MLRYFALSLICTVGLLAQESSQHHLIDANYFYGTILRHNKDISHLIREHPSGLVLSYNRKTFGDRRWHREYNYPDWGFSFVYQDGNYEPLGENYGLYAHVNFYFLKRNLMLRLGQGVAYNTNPFDLQENFKNNAYGTHLLSTTYLMLNYKKERLLDRFGLQAGIHLLHYSNGNFKSPNSSTNAFTFNLGLNYDIGPEEFPDYIIDEDPERITDKIRLNFVLRGGLNESDYLNLGQHPFWVLSAFADKRLSYKSALQFGVDAFFAKFLEKEIEYLFLSGLDKTLSGEEGYKRVGLFLGHELYFDRMALVTQFGYYIYYPYDFEGRTYIRAGLKYYITPKLFPVITLKAHGAKVEGIEFGFGIRI